VKVCSSVELRSETAQNCIPELLHPVMLKPCRERNFTARVELSPDGQTKRLMVCWSVEATSAKWATIKERTCPPTTSCDKRSPSPLSSEERAEHRTYDDPAGKIMHPYATR
jgi:hypothetical protein